MKSLAKKPVHPQLVAVENAQQVDDARRFATRLRYPYPDQQGKPIQARVASLNTGRGALSEINRLYRHARLGLIDTSEAARLAAVLKTGNEIRESVITEVQVAELRAKIEELRRVIEARP